MLRADAAQFVHDRHADLRPRCSGSPTPDSCRMCGEPIAPADRITSRAGIGMFHRAAAREFDAGRAACRRTARGGPARLVTSCEVGPLQRRMQIGARGAGAAAAAAGLLAPADAVAGAGRQVVDVLAVFQAELLAGLDHRRADRRSRSIFEVNSGPSLPRTSLPSPSQFSALRKNGKQSSHDQPRLPSCAQWS